MLTETRGFILRRHACKCQCLVPPQGERFGLWDVCEAMYSVPFLSIRKSHLDNNVGIANTRCLTQILEV